MDKSKFKVKPWIDSSGKLLTELELRIQTPAWTAEVWEDYLRSIETPLKESQPGNVESLLHANGISIFEFSQAQSSDELKHILANALAQLDERERRILEGIFYRSQSEYQLAEELLVSRSRVQSLRRRALKKLRKIFFTVSKIPLVKTEQKTKEKKNA